MRLAALLIVLAVVFVGRAAQPSDGEAKLPDVAKSKREMSRAVAAQRADRARRRPRRLSVLEKLRGLQLPAPPEAHINYGWPEGTPQHGGIGTDVEKATIYTGGQPVTGPPIAHEMLHLLARQRFTAGDKRRLARLVGLPDMADEWITGGSPNLSSPGERHPEEWLADYYAMIAARMDPRSEMLGSYAPHPSRRKLLRIGRSLERLGERNRLDKYKYVDPSADQPRRRKRRDGTIVGSRID